MSVEDPYLGIRPYIDHQANLLLDPIVSRDDPFKNGIGKYSRQVERAVTSTKVVESWPTTGGPVSKRECLFIGRQIKRVSVFYPLTRGYNPGFNCLGFSINLGLEEGIPFMGQLGQAYIYRSSFGTTYDVVEYEKGLFTSFKLSAKADKGLVSDQKPVEIFAIDKALMVDGRVIDQEGVILFDGQVIKGGLSAETNEVAITRKDGKAGMLDEISFPFSFELARLGTLMLGYDINLVRNQYPAEYRFTQVTRHPAGEACFNTGERAGLVKLRDEVRQGRHSEQILSFPRLNFARWLVAHGRIGG